MVLNNPTAFASEESVQNSGNDALFRYGRQSIGISGGHGLALPIGATGGGDLRDLQFLYLAPSWGIGLSDPIGGNSWYRGILS